MDAKGPARFGRWSLATTIAAYCLIGVGGMVRASGAGLGCPDWPKCFGNWMPPTSAADLPARFDHAQFNLTKTWTEYANRLFGVAVGLLIIISLVLAIRHVRHRRWVLWPMVAAFIVVLFEGWLGGQVVKHGLHPSTLTAHLVGAFVLVALLQFSYLENRRMLTPPLANAPTQPRFLLAATLASMALLLLQVGVGTQLRAALQTFEQAGNTARATWLPLGYWPDIFHRQLSLAVLAAVIAMAIIAYRGAAAPSVKRWTAIAAALVLAQLATGIGMAYFAVPPPLQLIHLWGAALCFAALGAVAHRLLRMRGVGDDANGPSEP